MSRRTDAHTHPTDRSTWTTKVVGWNVILN